MNINKKLHNKWYKQIELYFWFMYTKVITRWLFVFSFLQSTQCPIYCIQMHRKQYPTWSCKDDFWVNISTICYVCRKVNRRLPSQVILQINQNVNQKYPVALPQSFRISNDLIYVLWYFIRNACLCVFRKNYKYVSWLLFLSLVVN